LLALPRLCEFVQVLLKVYDRQAADVTVAIHALMVTANVVTNRPTIEAGL